MPAARDGGAHGAHLSRRTLGQRLSAYFLHHRRMLVAEFGRLHHHPLATFMTVAVIGIALGVARRHLGTGEQCQQRER